MCAHIQHEHTHMTHTRTSHTHKHKRERESARARERERERKREIQIQTQIQRGGEICTVSRVDSSGVWGARVAPGASVGAQSPCSLVPSKADEYDYEFQG
jgi:hypothetical protein